MTTNAIESTLSELVTANLEDHFHNIIDGERPLSGGRLNCHRSSYWSSAGSGSDIDGDDLEIAVDAARGSISGLEKNSLQGDRKAMLIGILNELNGQAERACLQLRGRL